DIVGESFDCIWVAFRDRTKPSPSPSKAVQWLDWKLQGKLSRYLLDGTKGPVTFLPTMKRIPSKMVALSHGDWDWHAFHRNCEGMKLDRILLFCEDPSAVTRHQQGLKELRNSSYPKQVKLATEKQAKLESE